MKQFSKEEQQQYKSLNQSTEEIRLANEVMAVRTRSLELQIKGIQYHNKLKRLKRWENIKGLFKRKPTQQN